MVVTRLALANFKSRWPRFALTILAVALSVALVVSITSGYASIERAIRSFVEDFIGAIDFEITRPDDPRPAISPLAMDQLRADPRVANLNTRIEAMATPFDSTGAPMLQCRMMLFGVESNIKSLGREPRMDEGRFLSPGERDVIVVDQNALENMKGKVGDTITFGGGESPLSLKIIGVIHKPALLRMFFRSGYLPIDQLRAFISPDRPGHVSKARGEFVAGTDSAAFADEWTARLLSVDPGYRFTLVRDSRGELDRNLMTLRLAS